MSTGNNNKKRIDAILVQETLWSIEDNIKIILECAADHEAELIRLRHSINTLTLKMKNSRPHNHLNKNQGVNNAG